jgi:WD40 repeat protein
MFSPDGKTVAAAGASDRVSLWDWANRGEVLQLPGHGTLVASVAFSPDGKLLATSSLGNHARLWEVPSGKLRATLKGHVQGVVAVAFSPDGRMLAVGSLLEARIQILRAPSFEEIESERKSGPGAE